MGQEENFENETRDNKCDQIVKNFNVESNQSFDLQSHDNNCFNQNVMSDDLKDSDRRIICDELEKLRQTLEIVKEQENMLIVKIQDEPSKPIPDEKEPS